MPFIPLPAGYDPEYLQLWVKPPGFHFMDKPTGREALLIIDWPEHPELHEWLCLHIPGNGWCLFRKPNGPELDAIRRVIEQTAARLALRKSAG